ncbi:MAG: PrsW family intramembrane metalloprotease [Woeseiaceae bacterium]
MPSGVMLLPVVAPILFWGWYHHYKDRHLPEPVGHLVLTFILGIGAAAVSKGLYVALGWVSLRHDAMLLADTSTLALFAYSMLAIGPIEEFAKMLPFILVVLRFPEFDEPIDGIIYASFIGLGYAAVENVLYLEYLTPTEAAARGFAGPVIHMLFASIWGFTIGCAQLRGESLAGGIARGFLVAAGLHGLYDFVVLQSAFNALPVAAGLIVVIWIWRLKLMRVLQESALRKEGIEGPVD